MNLTLNLKELQKNFIDPIMDVSKDGRIPIFIKDDLIYTILSSNKGGKMLVYVSLKLAESEDIIDRFNINISTLKNGLEIIPKNESFVKFNYENGTLRYSGNNIRFNIRGLESNTIAVPRFNIDALSSWEILTEFKLKKTTFPLIKKAISFSQNTSKVYIESEFNQIYFSFGDKTLTHTDGIRVPLDEETTEEIPECIFDSSILDVIIKNNEDMTMKIFKNKSLSLEIDKENNKIIYIISSLVK